MIDGYEDLLDVARVGAKAAADGDSGRSAHLIEQVAIAMQGLTQEECEWLSIAVTNGSFSRAMSNPAAGSAEVDIEQTATGEVWNI